MEIPRKLTCDEMVLFLKEAELSGISTEISVDYSRPESFSLWLRGERGALGFYRWLPERSYYRWNRRG